RLFALAGGDQAGTAGSIQRIQPLGSHYRRRNGSTFAPRWRHRRLRSGGGRWFSVAARGRRLVDDRTRFRAALGNRSNGTAYRGADQNGQWQLADRKQELPSGNERNLRDWAQALLILRSRAERHSHRQQDNPTYHEHDCPKQIEIDPAAAQEAKVGPFVDDDRNKPDRGQHGGGVDGERRERD